MSLDDFFQIVANLGFPIAVSVYLLLRFEKKIDKLVSVVNDLKSLIQSLSQEMKN